jgi:DNA-directed RNA polymerase subunit RPC12/RpoP
MQEAAALRCVCGYAILCEVRWEGERLGTLVFFDGEEASKTYQERMKRCPGCGEQLELLMLLAKNRSA